MTANNTSEKNISLISALTEHRALISEVFATAKKRILIVSPSVSIFALKSDNILNKIKKAVSRGVDVHIYVNKKFQLDANGVVKPASKECFVDLLHAGAKVSWSNAVISKILAKDDDLIAEGSFNWLSASRSNNPSKKVREERTLLIKGEDAKSVIDGFLKKTEKKNIVFSQETVAPQKKSCDKKVPFYFSEWMVALLGIGGALLCYVNETVSVVLILLFFVTFAINTALTTEPIGVGSSKNMPDSSSSKHESSSIFLDESRNNIFDSGQESMTFDSLDTDTFLSPDHFWNPSNIFHND